MDTETRFRLRKILRETAQAYNEAGTTGVYKVYETFADLSVTNRCIMHDFLRSYPTQAMAPYHLRFLMAFLQYKENPKPSHKGL
jgi:hypothetical protein